jgi:D-sedoheptulose 7-phosphate isomerase
MIQKEIDQIISDSIESHKLVKDHINEIISAANIIINALKKGNKVLACGNGGSALQAQHFTGELVGKFEKEEKKPLPAIALNTDSGNMTAIGNDYDFSLVFKRQIQALGKSGDVLICFSTSGNSKNLIKAIEKIKNIKTINLLGRDGGEMKGKGNLEVIIKSDNTARIQECHLLTLHILAKLVENAFIKSN